MILIRTSSHVVYEITEGGDGRWHWHRRVNGEVAYGNSTSLRRSARRAVLRDIASLNETVIEDTVAA